MKKQVCVRAKYEQKKKSLISGPFDESQPPAADLYIYLGMFDGNAMSWKRGWIFITWISKAIHEIWDIFFGIFDSLSHTHIETHYRKFAKLFRTFPFLEKFINISSILSLSLWSTHIASNGRISFLRFFSVILCLPLKMLEQICTKNGNLMQFFTEENRTKLKKNNTHTYMWTDLV